MVCVAIRGRAAEALRAAVGLTLRGAKVSVVRLCPLDEQDAFVKRCLGTLRERGHDADAPASALRNARVVEVWT
jgi:hypothetical protein